MTNDYPNTEAPPSSTYSRISVSRLNKAPLIQINAFPNSDFNNISVSLNEVRVDKPQGIALRNGIPVEVDVSRRKEVEYLYKGREMNTAPVISICKGGKDDDDYRGRSVYLGMQTIFKNLRNAQNILEEQNLTRDKKAREGQVREMQQEQAPYVRLARDQDYAGVEQAKVPLDFAGAQMILNKYQKQR